jgi:hypothetical protein
MGGASRINLGSTMRSTLLMPVKNLLAGAVDCVVDFGLHARLAPHLHEEPGRVHLACGSKFFGAVDTGRSLTMLSE